MPHTGGPRAQLFDGIAAPRERAGIAITVHEHPTIAHTTAACLGELPAWKATLAALSLPVLRGCARVPRDRRLAGRKPWCVVHVTRGDRTAREHELRHCEGWDHPKEHGDGEDRLWAG